ncbi:MAG: AAA family ATPase, partial [Betaproteobacteria bacterium]
DRAAGFGRDFSAVRQQIERVVVGHREVVQGVLISLFCGGHALLEGVPGIGKTLLIRTLSRAVQLSFSRIQFTPDLMPADITGTTVVSEVERPDGTRGRQFTFQRGPIFSQMVLADEINRATPKTQSALLEAMQENSVSAGGATRPLEQPFFVLATMNPLEMEGTYPLPEAQLDRFFFKLRMGFPGVDELHEVVDRTTRSQDPAVQRVLRQGDVLEMRETAREVPVARAVQDYAVRLTLATHPESDAGHDMARRYVRFGASPRGTQALILGAKVNALVNGRVHVAIEDIRAVALPALRHRLMLNFEAEAGRVGADDIIARILEDLRA